MKPYGYLASAAYVMYSSPVNLLMAAFMNVVTYEYACRVFGDKREGEGLQKAAPPTQALAEKDYMTDTGQSLSKVFCHAVRCYRQY